METVLIEFNDVTKRFGRRTILDRINLKIYEGHITTIIGKSGTGKSVLLKHIIGLLNPDEGTILFKGQPLNQLKKKEQDVYLRRISYMFQNNALFDSLTVFENVALPLRQTTNLKRDEIKQKVMARIEQTELMEVAYKYPSEISGGMQKRVALARALVTDPEIVLFDEPTTGQDPIRRNAILSMIARYQKKFGFTAILISHDIPDVFFISNRILVLYDGQIIFQGTPDEFDDLEHPLKEELFESLENLGEELTGLYSKRHFKVRYQSDLSRRQPDETYVAVIFTLDDFEAISESLGFDTAHEIIKTIGKFITRHFGAVGGFSTRQTINQFGTVLPNSNLEEARQILDDFTNDLKETGLPEIIALAQTNHQSADCFEFSILAGMALGKPHIELESVIEFAIFKQKPIAHFQCNPQKGGKR